MDKADSLNETWRPLYSLVSTNKAWDSARLIEAMLDLGHECAAALRRVPNVPLTGDEQRVIENGLEDDPRFYDLLLQDDENCSISLVLEWYEKGIALIDEFRNGSGVGYAELADYTVQCWDGVVPEYYYHQVAHMPALVAAQIVNSQKSYHKQTWLFKIPGSQRFGCFLYLVQDVDLLDSAKTQEILRRYEVATPGAGT